MSQKLYSATYCLVIILCFIISIYFSSTFRQIRLNPEPIFPLLRPSCQLHQNPENFPQVVRFSQWRSFSHRSVNVVISSQGKEIFETQEIEAPKKEKWKTKKRLKLQKMREKKIRKAANTRDPRRLRVKGKKTKQRFATAEERIKHKLDNVCAKILNQF
ncbi:hypothetical protein ACS0TY_006029 [Phlomoides rotata]